MNFLAYRVLEIRGFKVAEAIPAQYACGRLLIIIWELSYVEMGWSLAIPLISWQEITVTPLMLVGMWLSVVHYGGRLSSIIVCK